MRRSHGQRLYDTLAPNYLLEVRDKYDHVLEKWSYDAVTKKATNFEREDLDGPGPDPPIDQISVAYPSSTTTEVTDALGNLTTYTVDAVKKVVTDVVGPCSACGGRSETHYVWDTFHRVKRVTDGNGIATEFEYDNSAPLKRDNIVKKTEAVDNPTLKRETFFCYHQDFNLVTAIKTKSVGTCLIQDDTGCAPVSTDQALVVNTYDPKGNLLTQTLKGCTGNLGVANTPFSYTTTYAYYGNEYRYQLQSIDGPRTDVADATTFDYYGQADADFGFLKTQTDAAGNAWAFDDYDTIGNLLQTTDPNLVVTEMTHDPMGRTATRTVKAVNPPIDQDLVTAYVYDDDVGHLSTVTNPRLFTTTYQEDAAHRLMDVFSPMGFKSHHTYDVMSRLESLEHWDTAPNERWFRDYEYDGLNRVSKVYYQVTMSSGAQTVFTEYVRDGNGNVLQEIDPHPATPPPEQHGRVYDYDDLGRLETVTRQIGGGGTTIPVASYGYDSHDNMTSVTDANSAVSTYVHDDAGRVLSASSPDQGTQIYIYDPAGNLVTSVDGNGVMVTRTYDALNRRMAVLHPSSWFDYFYTYDSLAVPFGKGRLTCTEDPNGTTDYHYERRGLLTKEVRTPLSTDPVRTTEYIYDDNGNAESIIYPYSGRQVDYTYDADDRAASITTTVNGQPTTIVSNVAYEPFGPAKSMTLGNGLVDTRSYDMNYKITAHTVTDSVLDYTYRYDYEGLLASVTDNLDASRWRAFSHDDIHRLITANSGPGLWGDGAFTYDNAGNRLTKVVGAGTTTYTYGAPARPNRLLSTQGAEPAVYGHDSAGNVTSDGSHTYAFNQDGRLMCVDGCTHPKGDYVFDAMGRRIFKIPQDFVSLSRVVNFFFLPSGQILTEEHKNLYPTQRWGKEYIWLEGAPIAQIEEQYDHLSWRVYTYHTDYLGTPLRMTAQNRAVAWLGEYYPFGDSFEVGGFFASNNLRFPGQYFDDLWMGLGEKGLNQNWHRDYDPQIGRYREPDPLGAKGTSAFAMMPASSTRFFLGGELNLYPYVGNSPLAYFDFLGLLRALVVYATYGEPAVCNDAPTALQENLRAHGWDDVTLMDWNCGTLDQQPECTYDAIFYLGHSLSARPDLRCSPCDFIKQLADLGVTCDWFVSGACHSTPGYNGSGCDVRIWKEFAGIGVGKKVHCNSWPTLPTIPEVWGYKCFSWIPNCDCSTSCQGGARD